MPSRILHWLRAIGATRRGGHIGTGDPTGTMLVVDDLEPNARFLERVLICDGHRVRLARDGREALDASAAISRTSS